MRIEDPAMASRGARPCDCCCHDEAGCLEYDQILEQRRLRAVELLRGLINAPVLENPGAWRAWREAFERDAIRLLKSETGKLRREHRSIVEKWIIARKKADKVAAWRRAQLKSGNCVACGKRREHYSRECDACAIKHRLRTRAARGSQPWTGRGRMPLIPDPPGPSGDTA